MLISNERIYFHVRSVESDCRKISKPINKFHFQRKFFLLSILSHLFYELFVAPWLKALRRIHFLFYHDLILDIFLLLSIFILKCLFVGRIISNCLNIFLWRDMGWFFLIILYLCVLFNLHSFLNDFIFTWAFF